MHSPNLSIINTCPGTLCKHWFTVGPFSVWPTFNTWKDCNIQALRQGLCGCSTYARPGEALQKTGRRKRWAPEVFCLQRRSSSQKMWSIKKNGKKVKNFLFEWLWKKKPKICTVVLTQKVIIPRSTVWDHKHLSAPFWSTMVNQAHAWESLTRITCFFAFDRNIMNKAISEILWTKNFNLKL